MPDPADNVIPSVTSAWRDAGMSDRGIAGVLFNINEESKFNPALRHPDQPNWSGEAAYAHGLYQEGGAEWNRYQSFLSGRKGADWRDPDMQNQFAAWNLKTNYPNTWAKMVNAKSPEQAAAVYAGEYLKPSAPNLASRMNKIFGGIPKLSGYGTGATPSDPLDAIRAAIGSSGGMPGTAMAFAGEDGSGGAPSQPPAKPAGSLFRDAGFAVPAGPSPTQAASAGAAGAGPAAAPGSLFRDAGFSLPAAAPSAPAPQPTAPATLPDWAQRAGAVDSFRWPGSGEIAYVDKTGRTIAPPGANAPPESALSAAGSFTSQLPGRYHAAVTESAAESSALAKSGIEDIRQGLYLRGGGKAALGALGYVTSPIAGAFDVGEQEIDQAIGVPGTGARAAAVLPALKAGTIARAVSPTTSALSTIIRDISEENLPTAIQRLRDNPALTAMDVSPGVQTRAMGIATGAPSPGQNALFQAADARNANRVGQVRGILEEALGGPPDTVALLNQMKDNARRVGQEMIQPALDATGPVDVTPVINHIDSQIGENTLRALRAGQPPPQGLSPIKQRLLDIRQDLTYRDKTGAFPQKDQYFIDPTGAPTAGAADAGAHGIQSRLRGEAEDLLASSDGGTRQLGKAVSDVRGKLVDAIDDASGGQYKPALGAYRNEMDIQRAFEKGTTIMSGAVEGDKGIQNRPEWWREWVKGASDGEMQAARFGALTRFDNQIGAMKNAATAGERLPDAPFVRDKIDMLFGPDQGQLLAGRLADAKAMTQTNALLTAQSKTARSTAAEKEMTPREVTPIMERAKQFALPALAEGASSYMTQTPGLLSALALGLGAGSNVLQRIGRARDVSHATAYARLASTSVPEEKAALLRALSAHSDAISQRAAVPSLLRIPQKVGNALTTLSRLPLPQ